MWYKNDLIVLIFSLLSLFDLLFANRNRRRTLSFILSCRLHTLRVCSSSMCYIWACAVEWLCVIFGDNCAFASIFGFLFLFLTEIVLRAGHIYARSRDSICTAEHVTIVDAVEALVVEVFGHSILNVLHGLHL